MLIVPQTLYRWPLDLRWTQEILSATTGLDTFYSKRKGGKLNENSLGHDSRRSRRRRDKDFVGDEWMSEWLIKKNCRSRIRVRSEC